MPNPLSDVERLAIHTSDGLGLRAELSGTGPGHQGVPRALAVVCHPHPLHGGNMHNHVVRGLFASLPAVGVPTIRFNFRGTSGSEGRHGGGVDERLDVIAAIETIIDRYSDRVPPVILVGYSFGAVVSLAVDHPALAGWLAVAPPLTMVDGEQPVAARDPRPTVIVAGTEDEFATATEIERLTATWAATSVIPLPGEHHLLATASKRLRTEAEAFVDRIAGH